MKTWRLLLALLFLSAVSIGCVTGTVLEEAKDHVYGLRIMFFNLLNHIIVGVTTYYATSFVQVFFHRIFGHTRRIAKLYDVHVGGHHAQYAPHLLADRWIRTEQHITWYYAIPFTPMVLAAFWLLPLSLFIVHILSLGFAIWLHVYLHRQYHVRGVWLERFKWFNEKRRLHFVHHQRPRRNYAIIEYGWDRLFGTFDAAQHLSSPRSQ